MSKVKTGDVVSLHYVGTLNNETEFDNSDNHGEALKFRVGDNAVLPTFEEAVVGMEVDEVKEIKILKKDAYGDHMEQGVQKVPFEAFPPDMEFIEGAEIGGEDPAGQPIRAKIIKKEDDGVTIDLNHPLAGEDLNFVITLIAIEDFTEEGEDKQ